MRTSNLKLSIGPRLLLADLDWQIQPGECWCVIGRNGVGKSTLLRTLAGLRQPDGGRVELGGKPLSDWPLAALARERAFLPQSRSDAFGYTALETVLTARHPYHAERYWEGSDDHQAAHQALQAMEVDQLAERDVRTLSGGERQRVAIAALLAQDTPLLLLDEPANALDLAHQVSVTGLLARLCSEQGKSAVMVGHDLNLAHGVASHALLLMGDGGWQAGPVAEVMQAPILSRCLGHPIEALQHGKRTIFIPFEETT
ncbi:ABC transporter ATP-binding protein [Herminiimonas sp. CN]|uniref:ABC transporter ATP-binding protein n=1 Tax=Herminiimonas sp. CN TaxID=1349818 RepID=UPI000554A5F4|nr:ABC transporter ATP-binding protein [Herminiimonas sp. CN]